MILLPILLALNSAAATPAPARKPAAKAVAKAVDLTKIVQAGLYDDNSISWYAASVLASPDGNLTAVGGKDFLALYETKTGRQVGRLDVPNEVRRPGAELLFFTPSALSWDGTRLLAEAVFRAGKVDSEALLLFDLKTESLVRAVDRMDLKPQMLGWFANGMTRLTSPGFLPDGSFLLSRSSLNEKNEFVYSYSLMTAAGAPAPSSWISNVSDRLHLYADLENRRVITIRPSSGGCEVRDVATGGRISFLDSCLPNMSRFTFSPDGARIGAKEFVTTAGKQSAVGYLWDTASGSLLAKFDPDAGIAMHYFPFVPLDGERIARIDASTASSRFQELNAKTGAVTTVGVVPAPRTSRYGAFNLLPNGSALVALDMAGGTDNSLITKSPWTYRLPKVAPAPAAGKPSEPVAGAKPAPASGPDVDAVPASSTPTNPDAFAVVIGVEKYRSAGVPIVDFAAHDAKTMAAYLTGAMGFDAKNVAVLTDSQAGRVDFDKYFGKWLQNRVGPKSRVFVYYAGHGAPNPTTGEGYLMPYEADPSYLDESAYPVARLYSELGKLPAKDVTVVLDACFSGQGERSLIAKGTRPLVAVQKTSGPENAAVLAAASGSQISASDHEARHGLLTYHLLSGLHGAADSNGDGRITTAEAFAYVGPAVERAAKLQNVEQTPTVSGASGAAGARVWLTVKKP